jgi:hypothetical protein
MSRERIFAEVLAEAGRCEREPTVAARFDSPPLVHPPVGG